MSFDALTRTRLAKLVGVVRTVLTEEFYEQCQGLFGIAPSGKVASPERLGDLDDAERATASLLHERVAYLVRTHPSENGPASSAVTQLVREQAFTVLNRLAAFRMAEKRGFITESVGKGYQSKGFKVFETVAGTGLGDTYARYKQYLQCLCDELSVDLGVLFDRRSPHGVLFPREPALLECLNEINRSELDALWAEDETIGWIYQDYNDPNERSKMREAPAPRNSRELAVRNQFFTPRYVVEFLTDNTLGRLWYEMTQGNTRLTDQCRYLVRRPSERFLAPDEEVPKTSQAVDLSQEELLHKPIYIPHRSLKDPRQIRMLDPACGSMHFGLYAFDLFEVIYEEAWEMATRGDTAARSSVEFVPFLSFRTQYPNKSAFLADVPCLILEHNLHGIDVDPRAAQIAGLSLWLRAQRTWHQRGLSPRDRPRIRRSSIACAEPMPGDETFLDEFIEAHLAGASERRLLGQIVRRVFEAMRLVGEAGFLLKIEEQIADVVSEAKAKWLAAPIPEQVRLFGDDDSLRVQHKLALDVSGISDDTFWANAEDRIYAALRAYAEQAEHGGYQRRLFADDAARGFSFIDLCRKRYDVVLMNPPFGESSRATADYLEATYPTWNRNLLCAFLERGWSVNTNGGTTGAIFDRTAVVKSTYERFRRAVLIPDDRLSAEGDLGWEVLEANVEVTTCVLSRTSGRSGGVFFDVRSVMAEAKGEQLLELIENLQRGVLGQGSAVELSSRFANLPNAVIGYDFPAFLRRAFGQFPSLEAAGFKANQGFALKAEKHFRTWWELPSQTSFRTNRMFNGAGFAPYATALLDCAISAVEPEDLPMDSSTRKSGIGSHRLPGVCFGKRGEYFSAQILPAGHIFTVEGQSIPVADRSAALDLIGYLNTGLIRFALNKYCGQHKYSGYVNQLPFASFERAADARRLVIASLEAIQSAQKRDELQAGFLALPTTHSLRELGGLLTDLVQQAWAASEECEHFCDSELETRFGVTPAEAKAIQLFRLKQPNKEPAIEGASVADVCATYAAQSVLSYAVGCIVGRWDIRCSTGERIVADPTDPFAPLPVCSPGQMQNDRGLALTGGEAESLKAEGRWNYPVEISWGGILVDDSGHPLDIEARIQQVAQVVWRDRWTSIEREACDILGVSTLREYLRRPAGFFADHLKRYSKSRRQAPIYWPLSTAKGSYTLWVYYHRLTDQTLHTALADFVDPKIRATERGLADARGADRRQEIEHFADLLLELQEFRAELERVIRLPWKPSLNDGVLITASPLWKLFRLPRWQRDLRLCWEELASGQHDWAQLSFSIWPDRVKAACEKDRSIAVAHDLEHLFKAPAVSKKRRKASDRSQPAERAAR